MDFTKPVRIYTSANSFIDVNNLATTLRGPKPITGFRVDQVAYNTSQVRGYLDQRAMRDGVDYTEPFLGARPVQLVISVYGETLGDFWDQCDILSKALSPMPTEWSSTYGVRPMRFYQPTRTQGADFPYGIELEMGVRPTTLLQFTANRSMSVGMETGGFSQRVTVGLLAPDPRKYHTASRSIPTSPTTIRNRGSEASYATVSGTGTADTPVSVSWTSGGKTSTVSIIPEETDVAFSAELDKMVLTKCRIDHVNTTGDFLVHPGDTSKTGDLTVTFREAWL
jgi:hypothetical protein